MEEEERRKKIEYGRAKLALYRQRKARLDGQTTTKTKKISSCKQDEHSSNINEGTDKMFKNDCEGTDPEWTPDATEMRVLASGQTENPNKVLVEEQDKKLDHANNTLLEKQAIIDNLLEQKTEEEKKSAVLQNQLESADKLVAALREQLIEKDQENQNLKLELAGSKEKENHYLLEIKDLQQKNHQVNLTDIGTEQSTEREARRKLDLLQLELDEMYGREIMHLKEELIQQHKSQLEDLQSHHKDEMETVWASYASIAFNMCNLYKQYKEQLDIFNMVISGQNIELQDTLSQKDNLSKELWVVKRGQCVFQSQYNNLLEECNDLREQITRDNEKIVELESKLNGTHNSLQIVEDLKVKIAAVSEFQKELECKHVAEITSYQMKFEMLEKEKNETLKRMSESQEMQMQQLRKHLLISQEEAPCKVHEDLEVEHRANIEKLKDNLAVHHKHQIEELENEMNKKREVILCEKENLTSDDKEPLQVLIGRLQKAVSEECCSISKSMHAFLDEEHKCPLNFEINKEETENFGICHGIFRHNLQEYKHQVEEFHDTIQNLLSKVKDEHNKLVTLQMQLKKVCEIHEQQTDGVKLEFLEENVAEEEAGSLSVCSQAGLQNTDISPESKLSSLPESEESKERDKHVQGLESLMNTLEQQLKPAEVHYGAEIQRLQGSLQTIHGLSAQTSVVSMTLQQSDAQERPYCGNCLHEHILDITESYEFVAAIKKRDNIITRLAAHMQQSRKETDQILEEFFQLTERSEKVQFQDQHGTEFPTLWNVSKKQTKGVCCL